MDGVRLRPEGPIVDGSVKVNYGDAGRANVLIARGSNDNDNNHVFHGYLELVGGGIGVRVAQLGNVRVVRRRD